MLNDGLNPYTASYFQSLIGIFVIGIGVVLEATHRSQKASNSKYHNPGIEKAYWSLYVSGAYLYISAFSILPP